MTNVAAQPCFFGSSHRPLFGWLHATSAPASCGVVICNPFGYEAVCSYRALRHTAEQIAAAGFPALRFDYDGTGDSSGLDDDPDRVQAWLSSIDAAIDELAAVAGVRRICLLGVRLGATLATLVAHRRTDIAALIAVAPVIEGRRLVRELRILANTQQQPAGTGQDIAGTLEAAGYPLSIDTAASIAKLTLLDTAGRPAPRILILDRSDLPAPTAWPDLLRSQVVDVSTRGFSGFPEMMQDPHRSTVPLEMIAAATEWLRNLPDGDSLLPVIRSTVSARTVQSQVTLPLPATGQRREICEQAAISSDGTFSVTTRPAQLSRRSGRQRRQVLVLINAGAIHHVGPSRLYVTLARMLAARGMTVVRMDVSGTGDSPARQMEDENQPYAPGAITDIGLVLSDVASRFESSDIHVGGICSGAFHSLKAASGGHPLRSVMMINPLTFSRHANMSLDVPEHMTTAEAKRYQRSALRLSSWLKLLSGRVNVLAVVNILRRRAQSFLLYGLKKVGRDLQFPIADDLAGELRGIVARRTKLLFVFSESDVGLSMLLEQGGKTVGQLSRRGALDIEIIPGADHTFTDRRHREQLTDVIGMHFARFLLRPAK